jgi:hypothetical protein
MAPRFPPALIPSGQKIVTTPAPAVDDTNNVSTPAKTDGPPAPAPWVPKQRAARPAQQAPRPAPLNNGVDPAQAQRSAAAVRTVMDVHTGLDTRRTKLDAANKEVAELETNLAKQLTNLAPGLTADERQRYADTYRAAHGEKYKEATEAAEGLASYTKDHATELEQAVTELKAHPLPGNMGLSLRLSAQTDLENTATSLSTFVQQSPRPNPELEETLKQVSEKFAALPRAEVGGHREPQGMLTTPQKLLATEKGAKLASRGLEAGEARLGEIAGKFAHVAEHAGHAFGIIGAGLAASENIEKIADGKGRTEHYVGLAANVAEIGGGIAAVAGVTIGAPIATVGAAVGLAAELYSNHRDHAEFVADAKKNLAAIGVDTNRADALTRTDPKGLKALADAGYSPAQMAELARLAPELTTALPDSIASGAKRAGLSPDQVVALARKLGPKSDAALGGLVAMANMYPKDTPAERILRLKSGPLATDATRELAKLMQQ